MMSGADVNEQGKATRKQFEEALHTQGVFLSRDELNKIYDKYGVPGS